jgi:hypothetical protein
MTHVTLFAPTPQIRPDAVHNSYLSPLPQSYLKKSDLPDEYDWGNVNGVSYLTHSLNQHVPQVRTHLTLDDGLLHCQLTLPYASCGCDLVSIPL